MAILKVSRLGHPVLRRVAEPVPTAEITRPETQRFIDDMAETMGEYDGVGLAAPQVHVSRQIAGLEVESHPRYPDMIYPLDYGYVENTSAADGGGIDVWIGSQGGKTLTGILCTFDTLKRDAEFKRLTGCNEEDIQIIRKCLKELHTLYVPNPMVDNDFSN